MSSTEEILRLKERYPEISLEAMLKSDLLRLGVSFSPEALQVCRTAKPKSYFIFSFDRTSQAELSEMERRAVPEEIALVGGPHNLKRTIVSVRVNPRSPYRIVNRLSDVPEGFEDLSDAAKGNKILPEGAGDQGVPATGGPVVQDDEEFRRNRREFPATGLTLLAEKEKIADILLPHVPSYYDVPLRSGKPVADIAPTIEWGYLIYLTAFRLCQYWGAEEECQFCDINNNYRQQKASGRPYTGIKSVEEILEALRIIDQNDPKKETQAYTVTGGSITKDLNGKNEVEFYARYAQAIEENFPGRWLGKAVVQALPEDQIRLLKDSGYKIYHPNFEVWDKKLFSVLCPGKERYVGRDEWIRRIFAAAEIFGPQNVIPNFVAGVEMSSPHGFRAIDEAITSTQEGLEFFMSKGIAPRFTVWCVEPGTELSKANSEPPPLEYFVRLLQIYRDTFRKYRLSIPPGYGEAGLGKAVFSVSAFMDVL